MKQYIAGNRRKTDTKHFVCTVNEIHTHKKILLEVICLPISSIYTYLHLKRCDESFYLFSVGIFFISKNLGLPRRKFGWDFLNSGLTVL